MISRLKHPIYRSICRSGANALLIGSSWRARRLLILCYHGISLDDEHQWSGLYIPPTLFRQRLEMLRDADCNVLPLESALEQLYRGALPPRSVAITFDDGFYDFYSLAWPELRAHHFPVTVYLPTYYCIHNMAVFDPMCSYLLWKGRGQALSWPEENIGPVTITAGNAAELAGVLKGNAAQRHLDARAKDDLLRGLARRLDVDFDDLGARRILHLMNPEEVAETAREGVDYQLHTHRHRVYRLRERLARELQDNVAAIERMTGRKATHLCYPGGFYLPAYPEWLPELGIRSACTCELGIATRNSNRYLLPRLLDAPGISRDEFSTWLSGLAARLPRTHYAPSEDQLIEEEGAPLEPERRLYIIIIAYYFAIQDGIGAARPIRLQKYFQRMGYRCTVVTASRTAAGRSDMEVIVVPDSVAPFWEDRTKKRLSFSAHLERLLRKVAFPGAIGLVWSLRAARCAGEVIRNRGSEHVVLFTTFPPVGVLIAGLLIRLRHKPRWIADFRDPLADEQAMKLVSRLPRFWLSKLEAATHRAADVIIANTEGAAEWWRKRRPELSSKLRVVWNGFDPEERPGAAAIPPRPGRMLLHAGQLYAGRNADAVLLSLDRLRQAGVPEALDVHIILVGVIDESANLGWSLYDRARAEGWIEMCPPVGKAEALRLTTESDGLLLLQPQSVTQVPAKLFEYICIGRPILAVVPRGSAVEFILERAGVPYSCIYADCGAECADSALLKFLKLPSTPTPYSAWFEEHFDGRRQAAEVISIIEKME